jgi:hypothetical protein
VNIAYRITRSDLKQAEKHIGLHAQKAFYQAKHQLIFAAVNTILWIPPGFLAAWHWRHYGEDAAIFLVLTVAAVLLARTIHRRLVGHYAGQVPSGHGPSLGEFEASLENGVLRVRNQAMQSEIPASGLQAIEESREAIYIFVDTNQAFFIPKRGIVSGVPEDFLSALRVASAQNTSD